MASIVTRAGKGSILTVPEMDQNFKNLDAQALKTDLRPMSMPVFRNDIVNSGVLDPRVTFSRASTGTYFDKYGVMRTAAAGVPRIDYDPVTGECRGLLVEEQRTNLLTYSEQFDGAVWSKPGTTVTQNSAIAPDGTQTADTLLYAQGGSPSQIYQSVISLTGPVTISVYLRSETPLSMGFGFYDGSVDLTIINVTTSWQRFTWTRASGLTSADRRACWLYPSGVGANISVYIWGAQLEQGSTATSYIPTVATQVTRSADVVKIPSAFTASRLTNTSTVQIEAKSATPETNQNYCSIKSDATAVAHRLVKQTQSKNLLTNSEKFDMSPWTVSAVTVSNSTTSNPLTETLTVKKISDTTANSAHFLYYNVSTGLTVNAPYTYSVYAKASGRDYFALRWNADGNRDAIFNLATGTITSADSAIQATIRNIGNGWYRCAITVRPSTVSARIDIYTSANATLANYAGDGVSGTLIFGAQLEAEEKATKYVPAPGYAIQLNSIQPTQVFGDQKEINNFDRFAISTTGSAVNYASNGKFVGSESLAITQITDIVIGADSSEAAQLNGHIQKIAVYNTAATTEQLIALSYQ